MMIVALCLSLCLISLCDAHGHKSKGKHGAAPHVVACKEKTDGEACTFKCKGGKVKTATCMKTPQGLACGSPHGKTKGKHHAKNASAVGTLDTKKHQMTNGKAAAAHGHEEHGQKRKGKKKGCKGKKKFYKKPWFIALMAIVGILAFVGIVVACMRCKRAARTEVEAEVLTEVPPPPLEGEAIKINPALGEVMTVPQKDTMVALVVAPVPIKQV